MGDFVTNRATPSSFHVYYFVLLHKTHVWEEQQDKSTSIFYGHSIKSLLQFTNKIHKKASSLPVPDKIFTNIQLLTIV